MPQTASGFCKLYLYEGDFGSMFCTPSQTSPAPVGGSVNTILNSSVKNVTERSLVNQVLSTCLHISECTSCRVVLQN